MDSIKISKKAFESQTAPRGRSARVPVNISISVPEFSGGGGRTRISGLKIIIFLYAKTNFKHVATSECVFLRFRLILLLLGGPIRSTR